MEESLEKKHFINTLEAAKYLKVRQHDFANNKRLLDLEKISEEPNRFSKEDLEFWAFVFELKNKGFNSEGIKKEIRLRNIKARENQQLISGLEFIKTWLIDFKNELK
jgi:DNA-binding transcriptional MerR regulator